ncbi:hypothetical protein H0X32_04230 [Patescibacteria group bacterium]|nr:hypothetical protein [Patescibacteria group bacterium]
MRLEEILKIQDVETKASQIALSVIPDYDNVNNFFSRQAARHILQSLLKHCLEQTQGEMTRASLQEFLKEFHSLLYDEKELSRRILATKEVLTIEYMLSPAFLTN